jgi:PAS domain S-box-containing protein
VVAGWIVHRPLLTQFVSQSIAMVLLSAILCMVSGSTLLLSTLKNLHAEYAQKMSAWCLIGLSVLGLIGSATGVTFGLDWPTFHAWLIDGWPKPGRMSVMTAFGFLLTGWAVLLTFRVQSKSRASTVYGVILLIFSISLMGVLGQLLALNKLYPWFRYFQMALPTSLALFVASFGLWNLCRIRDWYPDWQLIRQNQKSNIVVIAIFLIAVIAVTAAGFSTQQQVLERSLNERLSAAVQSRLYVFNIIIAHALEDANRVARGSDINALLSQDQGANAGVFAANSSAIFSFGSEKFTALTVVDREGKTLLDTGTVLKQVVMEAQLNGDPDIVLLWKDGFYLRSRSRISTLGRKSGIVSIEQALPKLTALFARVDSLDDTAQLSLCATEESRLICMPQRRNPAVGTTASAQPSGLQTAMSRAVKGQTGLFDGIDDRGINVFSAYAPLAPSGLGLVIKVDSEALFEPVRQQLRLGIPILLIVLGSALSLLRWQVASAVPLMRDPNQRASERQAQIRAVFDTVGEGILTLSEDGRVESSNQAAVVMFGFSSDVLVGQPIWRFIRPVADADDIGDSLTTEGIGYLLAESAVTLQGLGSDGHPFDIEVTTISMHFGSRRALICVFRNISERQRIDQALRQAKAITESAALTKRAFLANISHEIRTPLNGVVVMTDLLLKTNLTAQQKDYLGLIKSSAVGLLYLPNDILACPEMDSRTVQLAQVPFDLRRVVYDTMRLFYSRAREQGLELTCDVDSTVKGMMLGDPHRLAHILINLTDNALKFTPFGSVVWRVGGVKPTAENALTTELVVPSDEGDSIKVSFSITDTGVGIEPKMQREVSDLLAQTDGSTILDWRGTGLGLSDVAHLVTLMEGNVRFESEPGIGSRFEFDLTLKTFDSPLPSLL